MTLDRPAGLRADPLIVVLLLVAGVAGFMLYWSRSNRDACLMNVRNVQQAARSHQGVNGLWIGSPLRRSDLIPAYLGAPSCPSGGTYTWSTVHPPVGMLVIRCSHPGHQPDPAEVADW